MHIDALTVTAVTSFLLAFTFALFAGMLLSRPAQRASPQRAWAWALLLLGVANLVGGIDHGFAEPISLEAREPFMRASWLLVGLVTFAALLTTAGQFFSARLTRVVRVIAVVQLVVYSVAVMSTDSYLVVILNYAPVILLLLGLSVAGLGNGKGSIAMVIGILLLIVGSVLQAAGVDVFSPVDRNGLYHLVALAAVPFLYAGGKRLSATNP